MGVVLLQEQVDEERYVSDLVDMIRRFVWCGLPSFADRLANATSKEVVEVTLYEALRISRSAGEFLCQDERTVRPHVAREESVKWLLRKLDEDLVAGLEIARRIAIRALA